MDSDAKYRASHRDELRAYNAQYRALHRDELCAKKARYYAEHRDERRAYDAQYAAEHRNDKRAYDAEYRAEHREELRAKAAQYHTEHREESRASQAMYRQTDAGRAAHAAAAHNRRVALVDVPLTAATILEVKAEYDGLCPYCNESITEGHIDHIVPASKGGTNDRENLMWACAPCNLQKGNKSLLEFMIYRKQLA